MDGVEGQLFGHGQRSSVQSARLDGVHCGQESIQQVACVDGRELLKEGPPMEDIGHLGSEGGWSNDRLRGVLPPRAERQRLLRVLLLEYPLQRNTGIDYDRHQARLRSMLVITDPGAIYL